MVVGLLAALGAAVLFGSAGVLQAVAVRRTGLLNPLMLVVGLGYLLGWGLHLVAIALLPLYLAQMAIGGSLAVTALIAAHVVHEPLGRTDWAAIAGMVAGFCVLILAAGPAGTDSRHPGLTPLLYVAVLLLAVAGAAAWRWGHARSGIALGLLAGLSYAGAPVATRALVHPALDLRTAVPAFTITLFGALGFALQSHALERVRITAATAPMVLLETFLPAALGIALFHDHVRPGWTWVAVLGFAVATVGALVLSGAEARLEHLGEPVPATAGRSA